MIRLMLKEEWRKNDEQYKGKYFALLPLLVFAFVFGGFYIIGEYSTLAEETVADSMLVLLGFIGLSIGVATFPDRSAIRNTLTRDNFLVYSSRTLPVRKKTLYIYFTLKEIIYYGLTVLVPIMAGFWLAMPSLPLYSVVNGALAFVFGLSLSLVTVFLSKELPSYRYLNYRKMVRGPVARKSLLDVRRSSGGVIKVIFSLAVVIGFYWFVVEYFPLASRFLENPVLSFSVMLGVVNITLYNWLNLFDSMEEYIYLPLGLEEVLEEKEEAFLLMALPVVLVSVLLLHVLLGGELLASLFIGTSVTVLSLATVSYFTGLEPNEGLMETLTLGKIIAVQFPIIVPMLLLTMFFPAYSQVLYGLAGLAVAVSFILFRLRDSRDS